MLERSKAIVCAYSSLCVVYPILQCANIHQGDQIKDENQDAYGKDDGCHIFEGMVTIKITFKFYNMTPDIDIF